MYQPSTSSVILHFPTKRGRPKTGHVRRITTDTGTPELVMKRLRGETAEALDLLLSKGLIDMRQHWCGIHLRWLYTLRYGAPNVTALDLTHAAGMETHADDPHWRALREQEYHEAVTLLASHGHLARIMSVAVYNERPAFIDAPAPTAAHARQNAEALSRLIEALDLLSRLWKRKAV